MLELTKREALLVALQFLLVGIATERPKLDLSLSYGEIVRGSGQNLHDRRVAHAESQVGRILSLLGVPLDQIPDHGQSLIDAGTQLLNWALENLIDVG